MKRLYILFTVLFIITAGCSSGANTPLTPQENSSADAMENIPVMGMSLHEDGSFNALGMLGAYELSINPENATAELVAKRTSAIGESYVVSGMGFFTISPCPTCLKIKSIELDADGNVIVAFLISHPFEKGDALKPPTAINRLDLDVFDLAMVIAPQEAVASTYSQTGASAYTGFCVGTDGYTTELNEVIEDSAALPYFLVIDDSIGGTGSYNKFEMGTENIEFDAVFDLASGSMRFDLYLTMGYGWSAKKPDRLNPEYFNPEFNRKSAWKVDVTPPEGENPPDVSNTWSSADSSTPHDVTVKVYDWQIGANVDPELTNPTDIYAASDVSSVSVEIPGMNSALQSVTIPTSGAGTFNDPLVYTLSITNENLLGEDEYTGLVKVTDERAVGEIGDRDFIIDAPDGVTLEHYNLPEFATYQTFTATVVIGSTIELTAPNGGEEWRIGSQEDITWTTTLYSGMIKLEYSKDGFVADINEIIASTDDDGIYEWDIPDDPSVTVRVRASLVGTPTVYDDSDADFSIIEQTWSDPVLIDTDSRWPRACMDTNDDLTLIWHKNSNGIQYTLNDGSGWDAPAQAINHSPYFLHLTKGDNDALVYAGYKISDPIYARRAIRHLSSGSWEAKGNLGGSGQPACFFPDDNSTYIAVYSYSGGFEIAGYSTYAGYGWPSGWADGATIYMASTNFHDRDSTNHYVGYYRATATVDYARLMRISKSSHSNRGHTDIFAGPSGETVDSTAVALDTTGTLHAVYRHYDGTDYEIGYATSTNQGASWSSPEIVRSSTDIILKDYVGIDTDSSNNRISACPQSLVKREEAFQKIRHRAD